MSHIVLLGDSIFDNGRYVPGGPSVIEHVRRSLPSGWRATLLARDGAIAEDVVDQLTRLPADATHLVISAGGNDALSQITLVNRPAQSFAEVLTVLGEVREDFQADYRRMLDAALARRLPTTVCTIYDAIPCFDPKEATALCLFNDVILRQAFRSYVPVIDLRLICNERSDYAPSSPIEPSIAGGRKIAVAILRAIAAPPPLLHDASWVLPSA